MRGRKSRLVWLLVSVVVQTAFFLLVAFLVLAATLVVFFMIGQAVAMKIAPFVGPVVAQILVAAIVLLVVICGVWMFVASFRNHYLKFLQASRIRQGLCRNCGYDVRKNDDLCPECGTPILRSVPAELKEWDRA